MRLTLSVYVSVTREEGRSVYVCQPARGTRMVTKDPLLSTALSKLGSKLRQEINSWNESRQSQRVSPWLYDPETQCTTVKLTLTLRDRTLKWRLLLVSLPAFERSCAFSPSLPEVVFEFAALSDLERRATEVYSDWAQQCIAAGREADLTGIGESGDMWVEPLDVDVETRVRAKSRPKDVLAAMFGGGHPSGREELHKVGSCLDEVMDSTQSAVGRGEQVNEVDRMLQREDRPGVLVVGPPAVGKTAIIHECVKRRTARLSARRTERPQVWWLSPQRLISGMSYLGQWEQRWLAILREANKRDHVLYFDDLISLFSAGRTRDSSLSAADVLQSFLAEHRVRILAEITSQQLAILRRRDRALADRFHLVHVPALSAHDALPIVLQSVQSIEVSTGRFFHPEVVPIVTRHQETYAPDQAFPGKAIEMLKTLAKQAAGGVVGRGAVFRLAGTQTGASRELLLNRLGNQESIQRALARQLVGQPAAIQALSRVVVRFAQHLQPPDRPLGVLLLLGPTGVGKTESAKALTRMLFNDESHLVRIDMNELTTSMAAEELVGTFERPDGRLTAAVRRQPNCVILLDEIEKAHPDVFDYLLQVLGEGRLTDARGRVADFRSSIILMTSNLGAAEQNANLGFDATAERSSQIYLKAAESFFRPEFYNRIDEIVAFRALDALDMRRIVHKHLEQVLARDGIRRRDVFVRVDDTAIERVIKTGFDALLGARAVRRMLEREIIGPLGQLLSAMPAGKPALIHVHHPQPAGSLDCKVIPLAMAPRLKTRKISDLHAAIDATQALYARLDNRLSEIAPELNQIDAALGARMHNASYYALREQLYRCAELRKSAAYRLSQQAAPRLDITPQSASKPRPRVAERGPPKSVLRDWAAHQDLRSELSGGAVDAGLQSLPGLTQRLIAGFVVANAMIEAALTPRNFLVGIESITGRDEPVMSSLDVSGIRPGLWITGEPPSFAHRLLACLHDHWQYEISDQRLPYGFQVVSGVSLLGVLGPLLGTYQSQIHPLASQLMALKAIPLSPDWTRPQLEVLLSEDKTLFELGRLSSHQGQPFPSHVICGSLGRQAVNYQSGASLDMSPEDWYDYPRMVERTLRWWIDCLPVPDELLESS